MPLRLRTKFTLTTALLVLAVAVAISTAYVAQVARRAISTTEADAGVAARQVLSQAQYAVNQAAAAGLAQHRVLPRTSATICNARSMKARAFLRNGRGAR